MEIPPGRAKSDGHHDRVYACLYLHGAVSTRNGTLKDEMDF